MFETKLVPLQNIENLLEQGFTNNEAQDIAVYCEDKVIYRKDLYTFICGAVHELKSMGLHAGNKVTICLNNSLEYIVYVYAASFLGITFIPVDPEYPDTQIQYIFENSQSEVIITNRLFKNLPCVRPKLAHGDTVSPVAIDENYIAYILYTSGTTGTPKGVMISRKALASYLRWACMVYGNETFFIYSSPSFDLSITSVFLPIISKSSMVIVNKPNANLYQIASLPVADKITAIKGTPSGFSLLLKHDTTRLKLNVIICGGEELTVSLAQKLRERFGDECHIFNEYGPTECTVGCMCYQYIEEETRKSVPIGKSAPGTNVFILDHNQNLCIPGKAGEIYLSGDQLATGYWNLFEENNKSFLFHKELNRRLYKTGDMARHLKSGDVEYLGRSGRQRKVHGFRVELDGIERLLKAIPSVRNAAVWCYNEQLIAAVESLDCTEKLLTSELEKVLPIYCIPQVYLILEKLPFTINGKIDYKKLQLSIEKQTETIKEQYRDYSEDNIIEEKKHILESVIRSLFQYSSPINQFNYFIEGGDSITALRLIGMLEQHGFHISLADILDHPDFEEMITYVEFINKANMNTKSKDIIKLPEHIQYLSATCDDFSAYRQINVFKMSKMISRVTAIYLYEYLKLRFPVLSMEYQEGQLLCSTDISQNVTYSNCSHEEVDINDICTWINNRPKSRDLFLMDVLVTPAASFLLFDVHHMVIDGTSWYQLIMATADYFSSNNEPDAKYISYSLLDNKLKYSWSPYAYYMGNIGMSSPEEFLYYSSSIKGIKNLLDSDILTAIKNTIYSFDLFADYSLLIDTNGRTLVSASDYEGLGCYSLFIPMAKNDSSVDVHIREIAKKGSIHIPGSNCIRINYMGEINKIFQETGFDDSLEYLEICILENLKHCSAFGCDFEITAWTSSEDTMQVYITSRTSVIKSIGTSVIFSKLQNKIDEISSEAIFWNENEELLLLDEIEDGLF